MKKALAAGNLRASSLLCTFVLNVKIHKHSTRTNLFSDDKVRNDTTVVHFFFCYTFKFLSKVRTYKYDYVCVLFCFEFVILVMKHTFLYPEIPQND